MTTKTKKASELKKGDAVSFSKFLGTGTVIRTFPTDDPFQLGVTIRTAWPDGRPMVNVFYVPRDGSVAVL